MFGLNIQTLLSIITLCGVFTVTTGNECTDNCDMTYTTGIAVEFCGTDMVNHQSHSAAFDANCYDLCGVMVYYQGTCGCPSNCYASYNQGSCEHHVCKCSPGFGGDDCSLPVANNACSFHGTLIETDSKESVFPFDYCRCDDGWTGTDCSSSALTVGNLPWGNLFDTDMYTEEDTYGDNHPIWNISLFATVRVQMSEANYFDAIQAENLDNDDYYSCDVYFDSGEVQETIENVGIRLKGHTSRLNQKHGWNLKFNKFVSGQKLFDMKKIGFKPGATSDDGLLKQMLYVDFMHAMGVPTQRSSYALLYINGRFSGLYVMQEDISPDFIERRLQGENGDGNTMKLFWSVPNQYYGPDVTYYQTKVKINPLGDPWYYYEQSDGDGNWTDYVDLVYFFNASSDEEFEKSIEDRVEVDSLLKQMVVESFMMARDNLRSSNNYYFYHRNDPPLQWQLIEFDFDECFLFYDTGEPVDSDANHPADTNVFTYFDLTATDPDTDEADPLLIRLLSIPKHNDTYAALYQVFIGSVFNSDSKQQPVARYLDMFQFVFPWMKKDLMFQIGLGMTPEAFILATESTIDNLPWRFQNVSIQLGLGV